MMNAWFFGLIGLAVAVGCDRESTTETSKTRLTSANPSAPVSPASIDALALARCDREQRCENIGEGRRFANRDACLNDIRSKGDDTLTTSSCPGGVDTERLQACLDQVRTERCDNPLDTLGRLYACRTSSLCPYDTRRVP